MLDRLSTSAQLSRLQCAACGTLDARLQQQPLADSSLLGDERGGAAGRALCALHAAGMSCLALSCPGGRGRQGHSLVSQSSYAALSPPNRRQETRFQVAKHPRRRLDALKDSRHPWPVPRAAGIDTGIDEAGSNYHLRLCSSRSRHLPATSLTGGALLHVCRCMIDGSVCSVVVEYGVRAR